MPQTNWVEGIDRTYKAPQDCFMKADGEPAICAQHTAGLHGRYSDDTLWVFGTGFRFADR